MARVEPSVVLRETQGLMAQYIGKTISLISVTDNRYVGLLEGIDSEKGVVTLNKVRCFGTEGRKQWGPEEIYPNPTVYETVTFNGNDVKDLSILDVKLEDVQPVLPPQVVMPPPQAKQQVPAAMTGYGVYAPTPATAQNSEQSGNTPRSDSRPKQSQEAKREPKEEFRSEAKTPNERQPTDLGRSAKVQEVPEKKQMSKPEPRHGSRKVEIPNEDFDFQSNNAKFGKPEEAQDHDIQSGDKDDGEGTFYNKKSSFFDTISTSTETNTNMRWQEERQLNMDTFGQASVTNRRGRGGFRGGRGQYRGRGRGGRGGRGRNFNNRDNSSSEKIEF